MSKLSVNLEAGLIKGNGFDNIHVLKESNFFYLNTNFLSFHMTFMLKKRLGQKAVSALL